MTMVPSGYFLTIIDLFGGIGAGVVCLKRLKIKILKIVHVEHCQVANAVYKHSHCRPENLSEIPHEFIRRFEDFEMKLNDPAKFEADYGGESQVFSKIDLDKFPSNMNNVCWS